MSKDNSGPAFPVTPTNNSGQIGDTQFGLSVRQWYAGLAMQGLRNNRNYCDADRIDVAVEAFRQADAMIAEGEK
jgi:hypothetical protein